jgi:hypothetical protein
MKLIFRSVFLIILTVLLSACPQTKEQKGLTETLDQYKVVIRWAEWDAATEFIAPEYQMEHPITRLQLDRLKLFKVTQYRVRSTVTMDDGMGLLQVVELSLYNKNQARERTITDSQHWKYNKEFKRWLLHSGLPDPTRKD